MMEKSKIQNEEQTEPHSNSAQNSKILLQEESDTKAGNPEELEFVEQPSVDNSLDQTHSNSAKSEKAYRKRPIKRS